MSSSKRWGLRLTLGGASNTPHNVPGLPGFFRPDIPTPVGEEGEIPLDQAREAAKGNSPAVELVELSESKAKEAEALAEATNEKARTHETALREDVKGA